MTPRSRRQHRLLSAGYLTLDLVVRDLRARDYWQSVGGTCGNVATFASALGIDVTILARVGHDRRGEHLLDKLNAADVEVSRVDRSSRTRTPGVVEFLGTDMDGSHRFGFQCPICEHQLPKAAVVSVRRAKIEAIRIHEFDAFFFDRAVPATIQLAAAAREAGLLVTFEPTTVPRTELAQKAAAISDIVKVSQQPGNGMDSWRPIREASTQVIVETLGSRGVRFRARSQNRWRAWRELTCLPQKAVRDAAGAGDWLTAGMLSYLLSESNVLTDDALSSAIDYGQRLSAMSVLFYGSQGALTALGGEAIRQIASGTSPVEIGTPIRRLHLVSRAAPRASDVYCELCLGDIRSGS